MTSLLTPGHYNGRGGTADTGSGYHVAKMRTRPTPLGKGEKLWLGMWVDCYSQGIGQVWCLAAERESVWVAFPDGTLGKFTTDELLTQRVASWQLAAEQPELLAA